MKNKDVTFKNIDSKNRPAIKFLYSLLIKCLIVVVLSLGTLIYIRSGEDNKEKLNKIVYKNSLSFAKIYNTYKKYLGDVLPFKDIYKDNTKLVSNERITYEQINKKNNGYELTVTSEYAVPIINSGIVIESSFNEELGNYVVVQDKNGLNITYAYLEEVNISIYDYIQEGELIGKCNNVLYLEFKKDDIYFSYEKYI